MKVICDAAHAAAFDFSDLLPTAPAPAGCDVWTCSLHKTLGAMNQCAVLNAGVESGLQPEVIQARLNMLQTTSPSYLLLASADYAPVSYTHLDVYKRQIVSFAGYMVEHGFSRQEIDAIETQVERECEEAVEYAQAAEALTFEEAKELVFATEENI